MKHKVLLFELLFLSLLLMLLCGVSCTSSAGGGETEAPTGGGMTPGGMTPGGTTPDTAVTEPAAIDTASTVESQTEAVETEPETKLPAETETETEPVETVPPFESVALPAANVAREGFALTSGVKYVDGALYSNVNLNDGDLTRGYSSEWGNAFDQNREHFVFIDLTEARVIDSLKLYPLAGDEGGFPLAFDVLISQDGKEYKKHTAVTDASADAAKDGLVVDMQGVTAKYVKLIFKTLGAGDAERGVHLSLGELEVYSPIDTASNMQLALDDIWLFKDPDTTHQLAVSYYRDGTPVDPSKKLSYFSRDPAIATVSEDGLITPVSYGKTEIYVRDGENQATCAVEVMRDIDEEDYLISTFFITYYVTPEKLEEAIDLTVKSGVTHLEAPHWWDHYTNDIHLYALHLCRVRGATYTPHDENPGVLNMSDEAIVSIVKQYENMAGVYGLFLTDEPSTEFANYARVLRVMQEYNPHYTYHLNLLPLGAASNIQNEYYTEFAAVAGGARRMKYLTFDHYPFGWGGGFDTWFYYTLDMMRRAGLQYNCDTGFYMQSQIMQGAFDALTLNERRYTASLGMAYGMKEYKHYLGLCPIDPGQKPTNYDSGILKPDYTPADYYDDIVEVNAYIKRMGKLLANADAVEVYHSRQDTGAEAVPDDFFMELSGSGRTIFSVFREIDGTRQYVLLTSKAYSARKTLSLQFIIKRDVGAVQVFNPMTGETKPLDYTVGKAFSLAFEPGQCFALIFEDGVDVTTAQVESDNLMLGKGMFVSSSRVDFWSAAAVGSHFATDGDPANGAWLSGGRDQSPWMLLDLGNVETSLGTLVLTTNDHVPAAQELTAFTVEISVDGQTYTEVATVTDASYDNDSRSVSIDLGGAEARYIRITSKLAKPAGIGEVAVYRQAE